jgi:hypothetical protein
MEFKEKMLKINKHIYKQTANPIYRGHDENGWHIGYLQIIDNKSYIHEINSNNTYEVFAESVCRCVKCLSDNSYVFEGDIIQYEGDYDDFCGYTRSFVATGYIIYDSDKQSFFIVELDDTFSWDDVFIGSNDSDIHIIGNIYDNTELIEELREAIKS